ncbi:EAL domain-containing protein [Rheinheimera sp. NSM]|uniref:EAL domain-containing protein n=1 Tax=Rheinheimera sp. NSM TaxID=3457884 RepID=UPI0040373644
MRYAALFLLFTAFCLPAAPLLRPLTPDQGLSQGSVQDMLLDDDGFLWLATEGGLNRYDGHRVLHLSTADYGLREVTFTRLLQDSGNKIYATTAGGDLYRYDSQSGLLVLFTQLRQQFETLHSSSIVGLQQYDEHSLVLATEYALFSVSRRDGTATQLLDLIDLAEPDGWFRDIYVHQQYVLIASYNRVLVYNMQSGQHHSLYHTDLQSATEDQQHTKVLSIKHNKLWIGTVEGLYSIELDALMAYLEHDQPYQVKTELPQLNIWKILWQGAQAVIPTESGLYRFTPDTAELTSLVKLTDSKLELTDNTIVDTIADNDGGFWLATRNDGAYYWHPRSEAFSQISSTRHASSTLSNDKIYNVVYEDGTLWVGTLNGLNKLNPDSRNITSYFVSDDPKAVTHAGTIYHIMPAGKGQYWLHTGLGLRLFDSNSDQLMPLPGVSAENYPLFDHLSHSYFAYRHYLYFFRRDKALRYNTQSGEVIDVTDKLQQIGYDNNVVFVAALPETRGSILLTKPDELWLWQPETGQSQLLYRHHNFLPQSNRYADTALIDEQNRLWVGMSGIGLLGFDLTDLKLVVQFPVGETLLSDAIYCLQQDNFGDIWFSSHNGLARLKPDTLQIEFFTRDDGLDTHEYNAGAGSRLDNGTLVFGSMRGLTLVAPELLQQPPHQPDVTITGISVLNGDLTPLNANLNNSNFTLSHNDLGLTLQFSAMNFNSNHKMQYRYWLTGSSNINYPLQTGNSVVFPQLKRGEYQFNVVSVSPQSGIESMPASLTLIIKPAPWLSNWAILLYFSLALLLLHRFYRFRRHQVHEVRAAHYKVQQSEQRLMQALTSVNSGAWEWNAHNNQLFAARIYTMLGYSEQMNPLTMQQHMTLIHPDDRAGFASQWQRFLQEPDAGFDCTYRMQHQAGQWLWFRDLGKATASDNGNNVTKVIGTFSNITETRANMEKARLFGEAFQQTRDWVVILDNRQRVVAANQSFAAAFGNMEQYLDQPRTHHLGISLVRRRFYTKLLRELKPGQHWQGEELVITPDGRERPTLINISAIGEQQQHTFYVLVFTDITAQKLAEDELRYLANYDALTGLPNRALLMDRIYHGIDQAKRDKRSLALCFIDLDKFKQINDSLGHDIGDLLLKEVARRLTLTLRDSDTVARLGGDEFVVLLEGYKAEDNISHVARKMLAIVGEPMQFGTHTVGVSPSIGIAVYPEDALNAAELLKHADVAMYHAKEAGRNNYQFFTAEMNEKAHMRLARETRLRQALKNDEFVNFYQPIVNSQTRQVVGAEVLLRWHSSTGIISPVEFIPLAEELRLIINMTHQLLERALSDLKQWHNDGHQIYLSINLSTQHLEQPALAGHIRFLLSKYQLPASCLRFEVTESALMRDHQSAIETMQALSNLGVQLALDDFGTGYSSLKYLKELPIDGIKIDRSFVQDIGIDSSDETIIDAMLSMANSLGMYCVAEGVETEQQLAFFSRRQCYLIQGYLFAKPMPANELLQFLHRENLSA